MYCLVAVVAEGMCDLLRVVAIALPMGHHEVASLERHIIDSR
jgi:hypothetical protein